MIVGIIERSEAEESFRVIYKTNQKSGHRSGVMRSTGQKFHVGILVGYG